LPKRFVEARADLRRRSYPAEGKIQEWLRPMLRNEMLPAYFREVIAPT
jgi:hypothetical protein